MRPNTVLGLCILLGWGQHLWTQSPRQMIDPIFGIHYDPGRVKFDPAPEYIAKRCSDMNYVKVWLYAQSKSHETGYFIVSGFMKVFPDGPGTPAIEADEWGAVVASKNNSCNLISAGWVLSGRLESGTHDRSNEPPRFREIIPGYNARSICDGRGDCYSSLKSRTDEAILEALIMDALNRYTKAFGGKSSFLSALSNAHVSESLAHQFPVVNRCLERFMKMEK